MSAFVGSLPLQAASKEEIAAFMARAAQKGAEAKAAVEAEQASSRCELRWFRFASPSDFVVCLWGPIFPQIGGFWGFQPPESNQIPSSCWLGGGFPCFL